MTGAARVAKAAPDGYQFVLGNSATHAQTKASTRGQCAESRNFCPVTVIYNSTAILISRKEFRRRRLVNLSAT